jgi:hypothetical protein
MLPQIYSSRSMKSNIVLADESKDDENDDIRSD